jgi:hypothetical protein
VWPTGISSFKCNPISDIRLHQPPTAPVSTFRRVFVQSPGLQLSARAPTEPERTRNSSRPSATAARCRPLPLPIYSRRRRRRTRSVRIRNRSSDRALRLHADVDLECSVLASAVVSPCVRCMSTNGVTMPLSRMLTAVNAGHLPISAAAAAAAAARGQRRLSTIELSAIKMSVKMRIYEQILLACHTRIRTCQITFSRCSSPQPSRGYATWRLK